MEKRQFFSALKQAGYYLAYYGAARLGRKRPLLAGVKLTHACTLRCAHCPFWRKKRGPLSFEKAREVLRALHASGVRLVIFEGGEPFLWHDRDRGLDDIVREAQRLFFCVGVTTNGTFPIETAADIVWVSVDGLRETHNRLRSGSFDAVMANIAASSHPRVYAHITINALNRGEIPALVALLAPQVKGITVQFHYPYGEGEEDLLLSHTQRSAVIDELIRLKKERAPVMNSYACLRALKRNTWTCRPWMIAGVDPDGAITQGCYVQNRGTIACDQCGFSAHAELSLAYNGVFEALALGRTIFGRGR